MDAKRGVVIEPIQISQSQKCPGTGDQGKTMPRSWQAIERFVLTCEAQPESVHAW